MFRFNNLLFIVVLLFCVTTLFSGEESGEIRLPSVSRAKKAESGTSNKEVLEQAKKTEMQKQVSRKAPLKDGEK